MLANFVSFSAGSPLGGGILAKSRHWGPAFSRIIGIFVEMLANFVSFSAYLPEVVKDEKLGHMFLYIMPFIQDVY